jgi:hypothetical protein
LDVQVYAINRTENYKKKPMFSTCLPDNLAGSQEPVYHWKTRKHKPEMTKSERDRPVFRKQWTVI